MTQAASKNNVSDLNSDVSKQMAVLREDIAKLTSIVADFGKAQSAKVKSDAVHKANEIAETGKSAAHSLQETAQTTYADAEESVRQNPAAAIGIAAGAGFLVGILASRR